MCINFTIILTDAKENIVSDIFLTINACKRIRGHNFTLMKEQIRLDVTKYSFSQITVNEYNKLYIYCS